MKLRQTLLIGTCLGLTTLAAQAASNTASPAQNPSSHFVAIPPAGQIATAATPTAAPIPTPQPQTAAPNLTATPPALDAKGYILLDAKTGTVLVEQNADQRMAPASLTKMMTSYIISGALRSGRIHADDLVPVSEAAWRTGGSKMFIKVGDRVPVKDLMQGIIVDSGNDACVAMAEYVAGSQDAFVNLMNQQAALLGMKNTHFMDVNGLPDPNHYTTPHDMAVLARALIYDFPEDYQWYSQKWFTYNNIKQPNRNRLLWSDPTVDGVKTGHTDDAGFCLVASAKRGDMRLISVVMGAPTDAARAENNEKLLTYGYRFFETKKIRDANTALANARVWYSENQQIPVGIGNDIWATLPIGQAASMQTQIAMNSPLKAPIQKGQTIGTVSMIANGKTIAQTPLVALQNAPQGGMWTRLSDRVSMMIHGNKTTS